MSSDALAFREVCKRYGRRGPQALRTFSARVPRGSICGLVGPNGAGKTTAFSLACGYLQADSGEVAVLGKAVTIPNIKGVVGVLPQDASLGLRHTPREVLAYHGRLQGLSLKASRAEAERVLDIVNLSDRSNKRIGSLSHGMRRRVAVASALVGRPALVMLDEPTAGLDPVQAQRLRAALSEKETHQTIVVCSHNLDELERICDWVIMMDQGECLRQGTLEEVTNRGSIVLWDIGGAVPPLEALGAACPDHVFSLEEGVLIQEAPVAADLDASSIAIAGVLVEARVPIRDVRRGVSLEDRFFDDAESR